MGIPNKAFKVIEYRSQAGEIKADRLKKIEDEQNALRKRVAEIRNKSEYNAHTKSFV